MINHARTLLLNLSGVAANRLVDGYEYVPTTFKQITLPSGLNVIRGVLFGQQPDQRFLNLRARELLSYVHAIDGLAGYVKALDPRITYWPDNTAESVLYRRKVTVTQTAATPRTVAVSGEFAASNATGVSTNNYFVGVGATAENTGVLVTQKLGTTEPAVTTTFASTDHIPAFVLPQTQVTVRFGAPDASGLLLNSASSVGGTLVESNYAGAGSLISATEFNTLSSVPVTDVRASWALALRANPSPAIATIMPALELIGGPVLFDLFGEHTVEPYTTFKNLWYAHRLPAYRLAAFTLALIYRTEALRLKLNG